MGTGERLGPSQSTIEQSSELLVAAGLLEAVGSLGGNLSAGTATEQLRDVLSPTALWVSEPMAPTQSGQPASGQIPQWRAPDLEAIAQNADSLIAACHAALPSLKNPGWGTPALRLEVPDADSALQLASVDRVGDYLIVPTIASRPAREFSWRWPLRVGIARGARSDAWVNELARSYHSQLFDVRIFDAGDAEPLDIAFVDAGQPVAHDAAACVVVLGDAPPTQTLAIGRERFHSPILIASASANIGWFDHAVAEMAHDQPIDVALRIASPASLIAADTKMLPLTAARQWAFALASQWRRTTADDAGPGSVSPATLLERAGVEAVFDSESRGATGVAQMVRAFAVQGVDTALRIRRATAMARPPAAAPPRAPMPMPQPAPMSPPPAPMMPPPTAAAPPPAAAPLPPVAAPRTEAAGPPRGRRLIADAQAGGQVQRKTLAPKTAHELCVRIAIPTRVDTAAPIDFDDTQLPQGASVKLMVDVKSDELKLRKRLPIILSTADRNAPSTVAVFGFRTPGEGSVVDIKILVTYQERPLQEAHYVATVRKTSVRADRVALNHVPLSGWTEPRGEATPANVSLEVNGANLERSSNGRAIDLSSSRVKGILDSIELAGSRVLADDAAPESLADPAAKSLLIRLARAGSTFRQSLAPLAIGKASTISLLVDATTPVLPLELVYDRDAPRPNAKLCEHRRGGKMVGKAQICAGTGKSKVCPYAFWGQQRVIARTIRLESARAEPEALTLSPVLYAATTRADAKQKKPKPSDDLEAQLRTIVGGAKKVARARNWSDWKQKVRKTRPQLLVVLGHTESQGGETQLEIGAKSWLSDPDIDVEYLHARKVPPPLVILVACASAVPRNDFGGLTGAFASCGAAAVVGTLTKLRGPHGARAAASVVRALHGNGAAPLAKLGTAMTAARHRLLEDDLLVGLLLVAHGEIDLPLNP